MGERINLRLPATIGKKTIYDDTGLFHTYYVATLDGFRRYSAVAAEKADALRILRMIANNYLTVDTPKPDWNDKVTIEYDREYIKATCDIAEAPESLELETDIKIDASFLQLTDDDIMRVTRNIIDECHRWYDGNLLLDRRLGCTIVRDQNNCPLFGRAKELWFYGDIIVDPGNQASYDFEDFNKDKPVLCSPESSGNWADVLKNDEMAKRFGELVADILMEKLRNPYSKAMPSIGDACARYRNDSDKNAVQKDENEFSAEQPQDPVQ